MLLVKILNRIKWWYWSGKYSKIVIFERNVITGFRVLDAKLEECKIKSQWYTDLEQLPLQEAIERLNKRYDYLERKWFGPRYIKG